MRILYHCILHSRYTTISLTDPDSRQCLQSVLIRIILYMGNTCLYNTLKYPTNALNELMKICCFFRLNYSPYTYFWWPTTTWMVYCFVFNLGIVYNSIIYNTIILHVGPIEFGYTRHGLDYTHTLHVHVSINTNIINNNIHLG